MTIDKPKLMIQVRVQVHLIQILIMRKKLLLKIYWNRLFQRTENSNLAGVHPQVRKNASKYRSSWRLIICCSNYLFTILSNKFPFFPLQRLLIVESLILFPMKIKNYMNPCMRLWPVKHLTTSLWMFWWNILLNLLNYLELDLIGT